MRLTPNEFLATASWIVKDYFDSVVYRKESGEAALGGEIQRKLIYVT